MHRIHWIFVLSALALFSCKKDNPNANQAPDSSIFLKEIHLDGNDRLKSQIELYWSGSDVDGKVVAYEISFDNVNWHYTTSSDSLFKLSLIPGQDTLDVDFYVRAIDDKGAKDPTPAYLRIPIKNTPPTLGIDSTTAISDSVNAVLSLGWYYDDPDGDDDIQKVYMKINNGNWYELDRTKTFMTIVPENPKQAGTGNAKLYLGTDAQLQTNLIDGLILDDTNKIYMFCQDFAGTSSDTVVSKTFYLRKQNSDFLVIDSYDGSLSAYPPLNVYPGIFSNLAMNYDYLNFNNADNVPKFWKPTFELYIKLYQQVFWYSDAKVDGDGQMMLEKASFAIQDYLNAGGKIMITAKLPSAIDGSSPFIQISPADSISQSSANIRIMTNAKVHPDPTHAASYPTLTSAAVLTGVRTQFTNASAQNFFTADTVTLGTWTGNQPTNIIASKAVNGSGNVNFIFWSTELHYFNQEPDSLQTYFQKVFTNEFNW